MVDGHTTCLEHFSRDEKLIQDPFVDVLPIHSEEPSIKGDVRMNVLGIIAIKILDIMHC